MPQFADDFIESGIGDLFTEFADSMTRYIAGDANSSESVTAIWTEEKSDKDTSRGEENVRTGTLLIRDTQAALTTDRWLIDGETWETISVGKAPGGMKELKLKPYERGHQLHPTQGLL